MVEADFFKTHLHIERQSSCEALAEGARQVAFGKGELVYRAGHSIKYVYFLESGIYRSYFSSENGIEVTDCIVAEVGEPILPSADLLSPSPTNMEALTKGSAIAIDTALLLGLVDRDRALAEAYSRILRESWQKHWDVENAIRTLSARERYAWFTEQYPGVIDKIPHRCIASYLGMTPVTLSRARSAVRAEGASPAEGKDSHGATPPPRRFG